MNVSTLRASSRRPLVRAARVVVRWSVDKRALVLLVAIVLATAAVGLAAMRLELRTSNLDLIDADHPEVVAFSDFASRFGTPNALVMVLTGEDSREVERLIREIGPRLRGLPETRAVLDYLDYSDEILEINGLEPFLTSYGGEQYYVFVQPQDARSGVAEMAIFVNAVRRVVDESEPQARGVEVGFTGIPQYALDDRDVIQRDVGRLSALSAVAVLAVLIASLGGLVWPLLLMAPLLVACALTLGLATLYPGHLTLLSAFFGSILFGLGIDFGIHALTRFHEQARGSTSRAAVDAALVDALGDLAPALLGAALTTAAVFGALTWCGFLGFAELGWVAGIGVLNCLLATYTVLPALSSLVGSRLDFRRSSFTARDRQASTVRPRSGPASILGSRRLGAMALIVLALIGAVVGRAPFDSDYLNLQPEGSVAARLERSMVSGSDFSPQFAAFERPTLEAARQLSDRLLDESLVGDVRSAADVDDLLDQEGRTLLLPERFRAVFEHHGDRGASYAVYAYPVGDTWSQAEGEAFIERMREIDPAVTGMPFLGAQMIRSTKTALRRTLLLGAAILSATLLLAFRNPRAAMLAALPTLLSVVSLNAVMVYLGLSWNPISVMALPLLLGIAIDDGIHLVFRFLEKRDLTSTLRGAGRSVALTSATTVAAFGPLVLSGHRGLASFATVLVIGVALALGYTLLVLPPMLLAVSARRLPDVHVLSS